MLSATQNQHPMPTHIRPVDEPPNSVTKNARIAHRGRPRGLGRASGIAEESSANPSPLPPFVVCLTPRSAAGGPAFVSFAMAAGPSGSCYAKSCCLVRRRAGIESLGSDVCAVRPRDGAAVNKEPPEVRWILSGSKTGPSSQGAKSSVFSRPSVECHRDPEFTAVFRPDDRRNPVHRTPYSSGLSAREACRPWR